MKRIIFAILLSWVASNTQASVICKAANNRDVPLSGLLAAQTAACSEVVVTSALSAVQSNISTVSVHKWKPGLKLTVTSGGSINPTTKFTGLPYAEPEWFNSVHLAMKAAQKVKIVEGTTWTISTPAKYSMDNQVVEVAGTLTTTTDRIDSLLYNIDHNNVTLTGTGTLDCNGKAQNGFHSRTVAQNIIGPTIEKVTITNVRAPTAPDPVGLYYGGVLVDNAAGRGSVYRHKRVGITHTTIMNSGALGALVAYADGVKFDNNTVETAAYHGFEAVDCTNISEQANVISNCSISALGVGDGSDNYVIAGNVITNCAGDGSITSEHNSIHGVIVNNTILNANTQGINVSFGDVGGIPGVFPFDKLRNIVVANNIMTQKAGVINATGINVYSSSGPGIGEGIIVKDNTISGFNTGISGLYLSGSTIAGNTISGFPATGTSQGIAGTLLIGSNISNNVINTVTDNHIIQLLSYAGVDSTGDVVTGNFGQGTTGAANALVYITGTGLHQVNGNATMGVSHYVQAASTAVIYVSSNTGNSSGAAYVGSGIKNAIGTVTAASATGGAATALPALPDGYVSVDILGTASKIPYYH